MKNLRDLEKTDAKIKTGRLISKIPAAIVNTLYGIGENPAIDTAQASYFL